jgi:hypothetical protein
MKREEIDFRAYDVSPHYWSMDVLHDLIIKNAGMILIWAGTGNLKEGYIYMY